MMKPRSTPRLVRAAAFMIVVFATVISLQGLNEFDRLLLEQDEEIKLLPVRQDAIRTSSAAANNPQHKQELELKQEGEPKAEQVATLRKATAEAAAAKKMEEEAAATTAATAKKAEEEAAATKKAEAAAVRKAKEEAAATTAATAKKAEEEAAAAKKAEEAAVRKAKEEAAKKANEEAAKKRAEEQTALIKAKEEAAALAARKVTEDFRNSRYFEVKDLLENKDYTQRKNSLSAYNRATVIQNATSWFPKRRMCKDTCCVETVAISMDQDKRQIINTQDGRDMADLTITQLRLPLRQSHLKYHASTLREDMLPCLVPGTVIWIENHGKATRYFFDTLRPKIQVPYTLILSGADGPTPHTVSDFMADPLLQKVYGTNPDLPPYTKPNLPAYNRFPEKREQFPAQKYQGMGLGLSFRHPQERHLLPYLHLTNFSNPFLNKPRWDFSQKPFDFDRDVFIHFGTKMPGHREALWNILCPKTTTNGGSCHQDTNTRPIQDIYTDMSKYRFGISPPGVGFDCYRTYELLLLGVIPVIEARDPEGYDLFEGLPVVHMPNMRHATTKESFMDAIQNYIESDAFQKISFEKGWEKLFMQHRRRQLLKDTGRDHEVLVNENGQEFFQAFLYSVVNTDGENAQAILCAKEGNCEIPGGKTVNDQWMKNPMPELSKEEHEWLGKWQKYSQKPWLPTPAAISAPSGAALAVTTNPKQQQKMNSMPKKEKDLIRAKYFEVFDRLEAANLQPKLQTQKSLSAYSRATVVSDATPWFPKRKMCKDTCCVETVAISLDQDKHKIINTQDGRELADVWIEHLHQKFTPAHLKYHGTSLREDMLPCLVPGTVIWIENHGKAVQYFFKYLRPKIHVPYTLALSGADGNFLDSRIAQYMADPLLQKVYGTNPLMPPYTKPHLKAYNLERQKQFPAHKFRAMGLGLSYQHPQEKHLLPYLNLTNFTNPFLDKSRWDFGQHPFEFDRDVFVHFGLNRPHRKVLWNILCPNTTTTGSSCNSDTNNLPAHHIYKGMSKYRFGISPPGVGYDCYRTWESLLLGVIPVIEARDPEGYDLFEGLPVVHMPKMSEAKTKQDFVDAIQKYIASDTFQKASFEKGWEKLFLQHQRHQLLKDTGRDHEILVNENGQEFYQAFQYSVPNADSPDPEDIYCMKTGNCEIPEGFVVSKQWMNDPVPVLSMEEQEWLGQWQQHSRKPWLPKPSTLSANSGAAMTVATNSPQQQNQEPKPPALSAHSGAEMTVATSSPQRQKKEGKDEEDLSHARYFEVTDLLQIANRQGKNSLSAYSRATVVPNATSWFPQRKMCKETCCVETVAISLDQDRHKLINGEDGRDLADVMVEDWNPKNTRARPKHLKYHGSRYLPEAMLPCMLPGTVIFIQNDYHSAREFWHNLRPKIQVPYILVIEGTDGETPGLSGRFITDPLLMKLYGTNPRYPRNPKGKEAMVQKYESIPLGLSRQHGQEREILPFMHITNFTNPFADKARFNLTTHPLQFDKDIFVHFSLRRDFRQHIWSIACPSTTQEGSSCHRNTNHLPIDKIYKGMSKYRFGLSPTGYGYDCYRHYELLLMGVIPVVEVRDPESYQLYQGLPVVQMANMREVKSQQDFIDAIENYIASDAFQKGNFEEGWKRLFLNYNRQKILKAAGRAKDILVDNKGRQFYQAFHYSVTDPKGFEKKDFFCPSNDASCKSIDNSPSWLTDQKPELSEEDQKWLEEWEKVSKRA